MPIDPGLYIVGFQTPLGAGFGVAHLADGQLHGGDSLMAYVGSYSESGNTVTASVKANKHSNVPGMESVFGVDSVTITLNGSLTDSGADFQGSASEAPGVPFQVSLRRWQG